MTSSYLEPGDVGPASNGHLRITADQRANVESLLRSALSDGRLAQVEYDGRMTALEKASIQDDLTVLTRDLVPMPPVASYLQEQPGMWSGPVSPEAGPVPAKFALAIFGGSSMTGAWRVPATITCGALFGGVDLDLTEGQWTSSHVDINAAAVFGSVDVYLPPDTEVRVSVLPLFGGVDVKTHVAAPFRTRTVTVTGLALFGGMTIHIGKKKDGS